MENYICFVCGKPVFEDDDFIWHGVDGDKIHRACEKKHQQACDWINNMSDAEFKQYIIGK